MIIFCLENEGHFVDFMLLTAAPQQNAVWLASSMMNEVPHKPGKNMQRKPTNELDEETVNWNCKVRI